MRLTLRTLLAYLDDTLEPSQARLIGQKVAESEPAQELISRIKQVTRRRRLTTPPTGGPGPKFDPNTIAEYVDNVLPAEQLAEVEETCMASDVHLAEVAACHQILTLVLGEPILVPPTARQRMYALKKGREATRNRKPAASAGIGQGARDASGGGEEAEDRLLLGMSLGRPGSWLRWVVPLSAACLLVAAALAIWMAMSSSQTQVASDRKDTSDDKQPQVVQVDANQKPQQPVEEPSKAKPPDANASIPPPDGKSGTAEQKATQPAGKNEPNKKTEVPAEPKKEEPAKGLPKVQPPSLERGVLARYVLATPGILLQRLPEKSGWQRVKPEAQIFSTDHVVSLPGYRSELRLESGARLVLWGNLPEISNLHSLESAVVLHQNPDVEVDFTLDRGLVVLSNDRKEGPVRARIRCAGEVWDLTLANQAAQVAIELAGVCSPYGPDPVDREPEIDIALWSLKGESQLKIRFEEFALFSPAVLVWDSISGERRGPQRLTQPPQWWSSKVPPKPPLQAVLDGLTKRLVAKNSIDVAIAEMLKDPDMGSRVMALRCLGAMDDMSDLVDALNEERHLEVPYFARQVLIHLLSLTSQNDAKLLKVLKQKNYVDTHAQTAMQLLHGFTPQQWANPSTRSAAAEYLNHDRLAIRYLTHTLFLEIAPEGASISYRPTGDSTQRERGVQEWKKLLQGNKQPARTDNGKKKGQ